MKELTHHFTLVQIQSVQTSLFHDRRQRDGESVDSYAQDLKSHFYKAYPQVHQGGDAAESMGKSVLASQFVARLHPALKYKVAGTEGFDEVLVKACFEEAKLRDLNPKQPPWKPNESAIPPAVTFAKQPSTERPKLLECKKCGGTNHTAIYCRWRGRLKLGVERNLPHEVLRLWFIKTRTVPNCGMQNLTKHLLPFLPLCTQSPCRRLMMTLRAHSHF